MQRWGDEGYLDGGNKVFYCLVKSGRERLLVGVFLSLRLEVFEVQAGDMDGSGRLFDADKCRSGIWLAVFFVGRFFDIGRYIIFQ